MSLTTSEKVRNVQEYWKLSRAYRGQAVPGDPPITVEKFIQQTTNLAGRCNCTWARLENHAADLLNTGINGKRPTQRRSQRPDNVLAFQRTQAAQA